MSARRALRSGDHALGVYTGLDDLSTGSGGGASAAAGGGLGDKDAFRSSLRKVELEDAQRADELFSILMGDDVAARRSFITRKAKDVRFLDV